VNHCNNDSIINTVDVLLCGSVTTVRGEYYNKPRRDVGWLKYNVPELQLYGALKADSYY